MGLIGSYGSVSTTLVFRANTIWSIVLIRVVPMLPMKMVTNFEAASFLW